MSQQTSIDVAAVHKSRRTLLEIMSSKFRYDTAEYAGISTSDVDAMMSTGQLDMMFNTTLKEETDSVNNADGVAMKQVRVPSESRIFVRYLLRTTINKAQLETVINEAFVVGTGMDKPLTTSDTLILVVTGGVSATIHDALNFIWNNEKILVVIQDIKRLGFNVLEHIYQPSDIHIATPTEYATILTKYNITSSVDLVLPTVSRFDPVAQALCARPGQMICYNRKSPTAGHTWYYRIVVD